MRLLEHFNEDYYARTLVRETRLHLWVPPVPGDAGTPVGAAYAFGACNPYPRELINERGKHREAIRPLAPMWQHWLLQKSCSN
jgi:predicted NodU family carbamoyl transferase